VSPLYRALEAHLETFLTGAAGDERGALPAFVSREFQAFLRCGVLEHGCLHVRCDRCGDDMVVAFSCKGRGFCPSVFMARSARASMGIHVDGEAGTTGGKSSGGSPMRR
jgi:Transposase zinc-binding domain